jgi:hypothetical protein
VDAGWTEADTGIVQTTRCLALAAVGLLTAGVLVCQTPVARGQSLADAAKRAEEQRQTHPDGGRSFTKRTAILREMVKSAAPSK